MKTTFAAFLIFLSVTGISISQSGWYWQNPLPQGNDIYYSFVFDQNTIISVGMAGVIMKTSNAGLNWNVQTVGTEKILHRPFFINNYTGWVVGFPNAVLKSTDGGSNWTTQTADSSGMPNSIYFVNALTGWLACSLDYVYRTTDGGANWLRRRVSTYDYTFFYDICFVNNLTGYVVGDAGAFYRTTDGGDFWQDLSFYGSGYSFSCISFSGSNNIWFAGANSGSSSVIYKTTDGGNNLILQNTGISDGIISLQVRDSLNLWLTTSNADIYKSTDGGANWSQIVSGFNKSLISIHFIDNNTGWANGFCNDVILRTTNGGSNWINESSSVTEANVYSVFFVNENTGWVSGGNAVFGIPGVVLKTSDGGSSWTSEPINASPSNVMQIFFVNDQTGWTVLSSAQLKKTTNGGSYWASLFTTVPISSIFFVDVNTGWGCYVNKIYGTTNGGSNWITQLSGTIGDLNAIDFINSNTGWIVGDRGHIFKTTNGGNNWVDNRIDTTQSIEAMSFVNDQTGWIGGVSVSKTTNGGANWTVQASYFQPISIIKFNDINNGWLLSGGKPMKTTNGGWTWISAETGSYLGFNNIWFVNPDTGWIVGDEGKIMKTTTAGEIIGIQKIGAIVPQHYYLHQNYPNPFNPTTKIKFDVPKLSNAKLVIYDVLGREVATLVNEQLKPGSYEVEWDGSKYASGIYFYQLVSEQFIQTKRMVLIK